MAIACSRVAFALRGALDSTMAWAVGLSVVAALLWAWKKLNDPVWNDIPTPGTFALMLRVLMYRGIHQPSCQGTLTVRVRSDRSRWLRFTKVIDAGGSPGFTAYYPRNHHTAPFYDAFRAELARRGVPYRELGSSDNPSLTFDFGRDVGGAYVTMQLLCNAWGARLHEDCIGLLRDTLFKNVPQLTGVDHPANPWLP